jgi:hypothetical protein
MPSNLINLAGRTRFRLKLELFIVGFGFLLSQALLVRVPPLDILVTALVVLYLSRVSKELKSRREPLTKTQKHILFSLEAGVYGLVLLALLVAAVIKQQPIIWIVFGLVAVVSIAVLFHDHEQLYKDSAST